MPKPTVFTSGQSRVRKGRVSAVTGLLNPLMGLALSLFTSSTKPEQRDYECSVRSKSDRCPVECKSHEKPSVPNPVRDWLK